MNTNKLTRNLRAAALAVTLAFASFSSYASTFSLSAQAYTNSKLDLGHFNGGSILTIQMSGSISLDYSSDYNSYADGSLVHYVTDPSFAYVNAGAAYPTTYGGDGINHFVGGGCNYDKYLPGFTQAGALTTDTAAAGAIRCGAVIGTFSANPTRTDWFYIGTSDVLTIPAGGAELYLAVNDTNPVNNAGSYSGVLSVPEPSALALLGLGASLLVCRRGNRAARR